MDHLADAEGLLREAGHGEYADPLRDRHLPAGAVGDQWSYEFVEDFRHGLLADVSDFENGVRADLAGGEEHVAERRQRREWRARSGQNDEAGEKNGGQQ